MKKKVLLIAAMIMLWFAVSQQVVAQNNCSTCGDKKPKKEQKKEADKQASKTKKDDDGKVTITAEEYAKLKKKKKEHCNKPKPPCDTTKVVVAEDTLVIIPSSTYIERGDVMSLQVYSSKGVKGVMLSGEYLSSYDPFTRVGVTKKLKHATTFTATAVTVTGVKLEARLNIIPADRPQVMGTFANTPENLGMYGYGLRQTQPIELMFVRYENPTWFHRNAWWVVPVGVAVVGGTVGAIIHNNPQIFCHLFDKKGDNPPPDPKPDPGLNNSTGQTGVNGHDPGGP